MTQAPEMEKAVAERRMITAADKFGARRLLSSHKETKP